MYADTLVIGYASFGKLEAEQTSDASKLEEGTYIPLTEAKRQVHIDQTIGTTDDVDTSKPVQKSRSGASTFDIFGLGDGDADALASAPPRPEVNNVDSITFDGEQVVYHLLSGEPNS